MPKDIPQNILRKLYVLLEKAHEYFINGQLAECAVKFDQACAVDSDGVVQLLSSDEAKRYNQTAVQLGLSQAKLVLGRDHEVILHCRKVLEGHPDNYIALNNLGLALSNIGELDQGIQYLQQAIRINPDYSTATYNMAAAKAERAAKAAVTNRIGNLNDAISDIQSERSILSEQYDQAVHERDQYAKSLIKITRIFVLIFVAGVFYTFCVYIVSNVFNFDLHRVDQALSFFSPSILLYYWYAILITLAMPILILLRLKSRDAEELKILTHDYLRMCAVETRIDAYQNQLTKEKYQELLEKQLENWMQNSPSNTLIRWKKKNINSPEGHPIETVFDKSKDVLGLIKPKSPKGR